MIEPVGGFLIDTNVGSEFVKRWFDSADPESPFASVITFGEIRFGVDDLPVGKRRAASE